MTTNYEYEIESAACAADLHVMADDINEDVTLNAGERNALLEKIARKFGQWNRRATGRAKGRWDPL